MVPNKVRCKYLESIRMIKTAEEYIYHYDLSGKFVKNLKDNCVIKIASKTKNDLIEEINNKTINSSKVII